MENDAPEPNLEKWVVLKERRGRGKVSKNRRQSKEMADRKS